MKIVVVGASGLIGEHLVRLLGLAGHMVIKGSPTHGVDALTGAGLDAALAGADVVVDVSNSPSLEEADAVRFFEAAGRRLTAGARAAGVRHHVALSLVGTEGLRSCGYFRGKAIQEDVVRSCGAPFSILRSTQCFEWIAGVVQNGGDDTVVVSPALVQPLSAFDVADALAGVATGGPLNRTIEVAGPERFRLPDLAKEVLTAYEDPRQVVTDPRALYCGAALSEQSLLPGPDARCGGRRFEDWLRETLSGLPEGAVERRSGDGVSP